MIAQQESTSEQPEAPETTEEADIALDSSDLIAMNDAPEEESGEAATKKRERPADTGVASLQQEKAMQEALPPETQTMISDEELPEEVEALDVAPEVAAIEEERDRVAMKIPSTERSKVGRLAGEPIALSDQAGRTIRGRIIMEEGTISGGIKIAIRGTEKGTRSDVEGFYEIDVPNDATLVFSMLGLEDQAITKPTEPELNVTMKQGNAVLSELLITGFNRADSVQITGASPISGKQAYDRYLKENLRYPSSGLEGTVVIRVSIGMDGSISETTVTRSLGPLFDEEAIRLIREGPIWLPAIQDGTPVTDHVLVEVEFSKD